VTGDRRNPATDCGMLSTAVLGTSVLTLMVLAGLAIRHGWLG
jgi:hypothetical protein